MERIKAHQVLMFLLLSIGWGWLYYSLFNQNLITSLYGISCLICAYILYFFWRSEDEEERDN